MENSKIGVGSTVEYKSYGKIYNVKVLKISQTYYGETKLILDMSNTSLSRNSSVKLKNVKLVSP